MLTFFPALTNEWGLMSQPAPAGINFLSGGQSEEEASANLNAMNELDTKRCVSNSGCIPACCSRSMKEVKLWGSGS